MSNGCVCWRPPTALVVAVKVQSLLGMMISQRRRKASVQKKKRVLGREKSLFAPFDLRQFLHA